LIDGKKICRGKPKGDEWELRATNVAATVMAAVHAEQQEPAVLRAELAGEGSDTTLPISVAARSSSAAFWATARAFAIC
jgi:hypothetical protein